MCSPVILVINVSCDDIVISAIIFSFKSTAPIVQNIIIGKTMNFHCHCNLHAPPPMFVDCDEHANLLKKSLETKDGKYQPPFHTINLWFSLETECNQLKLLDVLGTGSFGRVYRAIWRGNIVAAKVIPIPTTNCKIWENEIAVYRC